MNKMDTQVEKQQEHKREHVHFIGIGGYGMSAIARVMLDMGCHVTGSDVARKELTDKLQQKGARVFIGHQAENITGADLVIYSTDIPQENVELMAAKEQAIPLIHRSKMLARLLNEKKGIAVAGAHGKTTTSSMIALVMEKAEIDPTYIIGGEIMDIGSNAKAGRGEFVVAEADESDGTFLEYFPYIAVVTNIEPDHLENYDGDFENLKKAYRQFLSQVKENGAAVVCIDDQYVTEMISEKKENVSFVTYAINKEADYTASNIEPGDRTISFDVFHHGKLLGRMKLSVPGLHNVYNALATTAVCMQAGLTFEQIAEAIILFRGAKRRFQVIGEVNDILVVDDYAHHPTEIEATLEAARSTNRRIIAIFQPQRYTRTFFLLDAFSQAFGDADEVIIVDIYSPANDPEIEGVSAARLVERIRENSNPNAAYIPTKEKVVERLKQAVKPGDLVLTMGAGDIWKVAEQLVKHLKEA
ncbi:MULTISPECIES: UDP-N-acetylmuramate--L-alanine ligase [Aneurinibacillus]|nr:MULTISPECIES: UDP-N-acetylmuramate--L-alanine ligase [Aneurinibacillus]MED0676387.1 UDP-N-acetylmuramate--L-alanine ligase [Aneurinibacillus thermoaerophilus]MED0736436.1 UDP-N-acetylmuramate--L-alanine ligase [Aneurinibacillus thermoaerophilus]MED0755939.1 UDP-N-acetylmuramate--L-alanine ligase [Aneurinibacillus thermoaerophilus]MED0759737.1 UDP-N-acetylmuramate--L-alanine ligase [Aneurinibacillus thermoaerophilus]MED0763099.1 UDP-N-acetylmuramate--L-alanine ligase [Aneurinibacillus thermo